MSRLLCYMVTKNESHRYLASVLAWAKTVVDGIAVYDDQSEDLTVDVAKEAGAKVCVRPDGDPGFLDNEGKFRSAAWTWFEDVFEPGEEDVVLALDADEFPVGPTDLPRSDYLTTVEGMGDAVAVRIRVPEVFDVEWDRGHVIAAWTRQDGFWGKIVGTRLFRYKAGGVFRDKAMGSGAEPTYVAEGKAVDSNLALLHFGYADHRDREIKHERYSSLLEHGHNDAHIRSIKQEAVLEPYLGLLPRVWRGR